MRHRAILIVGALLVFAGCDVESLTQPPSKLEQAEADKPKTEKRVAPPSIAPPPVKAEAPPVVAVVDELPEVTETVQETVQALPPPEFTTIAIPSGELLVRDDCRFNRNKLFDLFGGRNDFYVYVNEENRIAGAYAYKDGKLSGPAVTYTAPYTQDIPYCVTGYDNSQRDGNIWVWNEQGRITYVGNYRVGRKHGLFCLVKEGLPWFIQDWKTNVLRGQYLVDLQNNQYVARPLLEDSPADAETLSLALSTIQSIEANLESQENLHKREFVAWRREVDERERNAKRLESVPSQNKAKTEELRRQAQVKREENALVSRWKGSLWRINF